MNGPTSDRWTRIACLVGIWAFQAALTSPSALAQRGSPRSLSDLAVPEGRSAEPTFRPGDGPFLEQPQSLATEGSACDRSAEEACEDACWWPSQLGARLWHSDLWQCFAMVHPATMFRHSSTSPRAIGKGEPLVGTSWLNRPYYVGWFLGPIFGASPIDGMDQGNGAFGGLLLGWDMDHYWGTQLRFGWAAMQLTDRDFPQRIRNDDVFVTDLSLLYYPWGDSRWRPYGLFGLGAASFSFADQRWVGHDTTLLGMPFGGGLKYQFRRWWAFRVELLDNVAFGSEGLNTMHNVSLTIDMEVRWGARPKSYWPWQAERHVW